MISVAQAGELRRWDDRLRSELPVVAAAPSHPGECFVQPTIYLDEDGTSPLVTQEIFGPLAALVAAKGIGDHARIAGASSAGLSAAVYGSNADDLRAFLNVVDAGVASTGPRPDSTHMRRGEGKGVHFP